MLFNILHLSLSCFFSQWCKFDDEVVSRCYAKEAVQQNYGGVDEHDNSVRNCTNAYMLVYIRESHLSEVLCEVEENDIPVDLVERLEEEKNVEAQRRKERDEAPNYLTMSVVLEEPFYSNYSCDLISLESNRFQEFRVNNSVPPTPCFYFIQFENVFVNILLCHFVNSESLTEFILLIRSFSFLNV